MKEKKGKLGRMKDALPGEELLSKPLSRKGFVAGAGATSFGLLLAACGGGDNEEAAPPAPPAEPPPAASEAATTSAAPSGEEAPLKEGLADGMYGGPVGWPGAERYQYPFDSEEGRAIAGLRKLVQDGTAPDKLVVQVLNFARPQFEKAFPEGAISHVALFEEETGIKIEFVETEPASEYQENLRNASTKNGSFDLVTHGDRGDRRLRGGRSPARRSTTTSNTYQPSWNDPDVRVRGRRADREPVHEVQGHDLRGRGRQRHAAVLLPLRPAREPGGADGVRGQVRPTARVPDHVGRPRPGGRVLHAEGPEALRRREHARAVLGSGEVQRAVRVGRKPEHDLLQRRRLGQRQQRGRRPRVRRAPEVARVPRARARSRRTGSRSTSSWAPATASWAARSRTRRSSSRATPTSTRPTSASTSRATSPRVASSTAFSSVGR